MTAGQGKCWIANYFRGAGRIAWTPVESMTAFLSVGDTRIYVCALEPLICPLVWGITRSHEDSSRKYPDADKPSQ